MGIIFLLTHLNKLTKVSLVSNIYLLIFLPLISSLFCQIFGKRGVSFLIAITACVALFFMIIRIFPDILIYEKVSNDFELSPLSLALEFRLDILGAAFLLLAVFLKIVILFFYASDIKKFLNERNDRIFYSVFLLQLFGLVGIFTTNNLLNLFLFFEIYAFSFFATISISRDNNLLKLSFRYFCLNAVSSLLTLFCILVIYLTFDEVRIDRISENLSMLSGSQAWFVITISLLLIASLITKFFPFWLYFEKLKSDSLIANFLTIESLFIKTIVGIFLVVKFTYFFGYSMLFDRFWFMEISILIAASLIVYSSFKICKQKHLKIIATYLCLNNLGFIILCLALYSLDSLRAMFFYLLNFSLVNLLIFIFSTFLKRYYHTSALSKIFLIKQDHFSLVLPLKFLTFAIVAFPMTILFFANWYFAQASIGFGPRSSLLIFVVIANFSYMVLVIRLISVFFAEKPAERNELRQVGFKKYQYLVSFWFLIMAIYTISLASGQVNNVSDKFAHYLLLDPTSKKFNP